MLYVSLSSRITLTICLIFISSPLLLSQTTGNHSLESDSLALVDFYNALDGPNWGDVGEGWLIENIEDWKGVEIDNDRVSVLNIFGASSYSALELQGHVPASIGNLDALKRLWIYENGIQSLPEEISNLKSLQFFLIETPTFVGPIPDIFEGLESLRQFRWLGNEQMSGPLPSSLSQLPNLDALQLTGFPLSSFQIESGQYQKLKRLLLKDALNENNIDQFSASLTHLNSLEYLSLSSVEIESIMPSEIFQITSLKQLDLINSEWTGSLPDEIGQLVNLEGLILDSTGFSGSLPSSLGMLDQLRFLFLVDTDFEGELPKSLAQLNALKEVDIHNTRLSGSVATILDASDQFIIIEISGNQFSGEIPPSIQDNSNLFRLNLSNNQFEGKIGINFAALDSLDIPDGGHCLLGDNASSLCIEDTVENRSIGNDGFCGITFCASPVNNTAETPVSENKIEIYPNPASTHIDISSEGVEIERVQVFDILGRMKIESQGFETNRIDISGLSAGQYIVHISNPNGSVTVKPVIVLD